MNTPAGWYAHDEGRERYWDGQQWTDSFRSHPLHPSSPPGHGRTGSRTWITYIGIGLGGLALGALIGSVGGQDGTAPEAIPAVTVTATTTETAPDADAGEPLRQVPGGTVTVTAPPLAPAAAITEGAWLVGEDIEPGRYRTIGEVGGDCYWSITRAGSNGAEILENDIVTGGRPTVTLSAGQEFTTHSCGEWAKS